VPGVKIKFKKIIFGVIFATVISVAGFWIYAATYYSSALLVSADLLVGQTVNSVDYFGYNCSIPAGASLKVQFSQDKVNWFSAGHIADTWTDLVDGSHLDEGSGALELSGYFEPGFYYKVQFDTSDTAVTPNLVAVNLIYNGKTYGSVSTQPATSIMGIMATGNGNITSMGDSAITKRGFQYGISQTSGLMEVSETGSFGTGEFSLTLTNLYAGNLYYVRAFAQNTEGKSYYGDWQEFTTLNNYYYSSAVVNSANLLAGQTTNNINGFYVSMNMPAGTNATAQFSQNNSTWYSAAGTLGGTTSLQDGGNQIDLTPLAWSGSAFYYKIALNSNANRSATPVLESVALNYNVSSYPSDSNSSVSTPTWATNDVVFSITATDFESDDYYLAICKTNSITPNNNAAPACAGGSWCVSGAAAVGSQATCSYETQISDEGNNAWYAFVCDHDPDSSCSIAMQGSGNSGSPFVVSVDSTPPSASDDFSNNNIWVNSNQTITLTSSDSESGVAWTRYCQDTLNTCDPSSGTNYTGPVEISTENISYFRYASADNVGNTQPTVSLTVKIDKTGPTVNAGSDQTKNSQFLQDATAAPNQAPIASYLWEKVSGSGIITFGTPTAEDTTIEADANDTYVIRLTVTDQASNEISDTFVLTWDTTPPYTGPGGAGGFVISPETETEQLPENEQLSEETTEIQESPIQEPKPQNQNIISQISQQLENLISEIDNIFVPKQEPKEEIIIPQETPPAFENLQNANLMGNTIPESVGIAFVGDNLSFFSQKLPDFGQTLQGLGVNLQSLQENNGASFVVPSLSALVFGNAGLPSTGFNVANLTKGQAQKVPTDIVFATSASQTIEHNLALNVDPLGNVEQAINVLTSQKVTLSVRPESEAKSIVGYVILKNKISAKENWLGKLAKYFTAALTGPVSQTQQADGLLLDRFEYQDMGNGIWQAEFTAPTDPGQYEVDAVVEYVNQSLAPKGMKLIVVVDPEGYVFTNLPQGELRVKDAVVSIYWQNPETGEYKLWPAKTYFQQNPQTTDSTGRYVFLTPPGWYYLTATANGYKEYQGQPFEVVKDVGVHINLELKKEFLWQDWLDWKIILIAVFGLIILAGIIFIIVKIYGKTKNN
jgi:hypothetical protein